MPTSVSLLFTRCLSLVAKMHGHVSLASLIARQPAITRKAARGV